MQKRGREEPTSEVGEVAKRSYRCPRSGAAAERSYPISEVRGGGQEELSHVRGQGWWPRVPGCDSTGAADRSYPTSKERWLHRYRKAERSYSTFKVRRGSGEKIPLVQGKEQRLCFAGADVKKYPMPKVRETQVRW